MAKNSNCTTERVGRKAAPPAFYSKINNGFDIVARWIEFTLGIAFIFAVALNFFTAFDRYIFKKSIVGADEVQIYILVWMTFVGAAIVTWRHQHLRMDVLASRFPRFLRLFLLGAELALALALMVLLMSQSTKYAVQMSLIDRRSDLTGLPMWIPHIALAIGFGLIALMTAWRIVELIINRAEPETLTSEARL